MSDHDELFTIGQLARRTGLTVRTIRFWSDSGLVPPTGRSRSGYRLFGADALGRLDLVRTLRELGLDLDTVQRVLARTATIADVARTHARALDVEIRVLQTRRAVLRVVAARGGTTEEMTVVHKLARLSAQERQRVIDDFVDHAFDGIDPAAPGAGIADAMRRMPAELPENPTVEQVDAWIELAELVNDDGFRQRVRQMATTGAREPSPPRGHDPASVLEHAGGAVAAGIDPESAEGRQVLDRIVPSDMPAAERRALADNLDTFTDRRVERYWQLLGTLNGWPPAPAHVPAFEWLIAALRAHL